MRAPGVEASARLGPGAGQDIGRTHGPVHPDRRRVLAQGIFLPARSADLLWVEYTEDEVRAIAAALQFAADHPDLDLLALMPELRRTNDEIRSFLAKIHASVLKAMERRPGRLAAK